MPPGSASTERAGAPVDGEGIRRAYRILFDPLAAWPSVVGYALLVAAIGVSTGDLAERVAAGEVAAGVTAAVFAVGSVWRSRKVRHTLATEATAVLDSAVRKQLVLFGDWRVVFAILACLLLVANLALVGKILLRRESLIADGGSSILAGLAFTWLMGWDFLLRPRRAARAAGLA